MSLVQFVNKVGEELEQGDVVVLPEEYSHQ